MGIDNDEKDEVGAGLEGEFVCVGRGALGMLFFLAGERINFEDHGDYVVVKFDDFMRLADKASHLADGLALTDEEKH